MRSQSSAAVILSIYAVAGRWWQNVLSTLLIDLQPYKHHGHSRSRCSGDLLKRRRGVGQWPLPVGYTASDGSRNQKMQRLAGVVTPTAA